MNGESSEEQGRIEDQSKVWADFNCIPIILDDFVVIHIETIWALNNEFIMIGRFLSFKIKHCFNSLVFSFVKY